MVDPHVPASASETVHVDNLAGPCVGHAAVAAVVVGCDGRQSITSVHGETRQAATAASVPAVVDFDETNINAAPQVDAEPVRPVPRRVAAASLAPHETGVVSVDARSRRRTRVVSVHRRGTLQGAVRRKHHDFAYIDGGHRVLRAFVSSSNPYVPCELWLGTNHVGQLAGARNVAAVAAVVVCCH